MTCLTLYWEFTVKLFISSDLIYQIYLAINARRINKNRDNHKNHNTRYNVVHPQCRGYVHRTVFYSTCYKTTVLICAHSCRSLQSLKSAHTAAGLCAHSCRSFLNILTKTLYTHSWDLTFPYIISLSFAFIFLHQKA